MRTKSLVSGVGCSLAQPSEFTRATTFSYFFHRVLRSKKLCQYNCCQGSCHGSVPTTISFAALTLPPSACVASRCSASSKCWTVYSRFDFRCFILQSHLGSYFYDIVKKRLTHQIHRDFYMVVIYFHSRFCFVRDYCLYSRKQSFISTS